MSDGHWCSDTITRDSPQSTPTCSSHLWPQVCLLSSTQRKLELEPSRIGLMDLEWSLERVGVGVRAGIVGGGICLYNWLCGGKEGLRVLHYNLTGETKGEMCPAALHLSRKGFMSPKSSSPPIILLSNSPILYFSVLPIFQFSNPLFLQSSKPLFLRSSSFPFPSSPLGKV